MSVRFWHQRMFLFHYPPDPLRGALPLAEKWCSSTILHGIREYPSNRWRCSTKRAQHSFTILPLAHCTENTISRWTPSHLLSWKTCLRTAFHQVTVCTTIAEKANLASPHHAAWVKRQWCPCLPEVDQNLVTSKTYVFQNKWCGNINKPALCIWE